MPIKKSLIVKPRSILSVPVYSLAGVASGSMELPKEIFGRKVNNGLLAQAARVYSTNQKTLLGSTKRRREVVASKTKIYAQKGTGRARHGAISAPIFVGGGIAFGPKPRKVRLQMPKKLKKAALYQALSNKAIDKKIFGLTSLDKATGKTKEFVNLMNKIFKDKQSNALIITGTKSDNVVRAIRNMQKLHVSQVNSINAYNILNHEVLLFTKDAVNKMVEPEGVKK